MEVSILSLTDGARKAEGISVIIDVFRAFSMEAYLFSQGAEKIYAVGDETKARKLKNEHPEYILIGERHGRILPGFAYGNSPASIKDHSFTGRTFVHTTTNGTQGIANAVNADEILTGSFVNAKATADYILAQHPDKVSLVAMGWEGYDTEEDLLCAAYIRSLLVNQPIPDLEQKMAHLAVGEGKKFFDPAQQDVFPQEDYEMCVKRDIFPFVIKVEQENGTAVCRKKTIYE